MKIYGPIFWNDTVMYGTIEIENGRVIDISRSTTGYDIKGVFVPYFTNMHTHIGDSFIIEEPHGSIAEIVGPGGFKAKKLQTANKKLQQLAIRSNLQLMIKEHIHTFVDFREGGIYGINLLKDVLCSKIQVKILSRPQSIEYDQDEIDLLLKNSAGIGLSSVLDYPIDVVLKISKKVHEQHKIFALHASERVREDIDFILDLKPAFLVHMHKATDADLMRVAQENVSIVITPRSNSQFGFVPALARFIKHGINVALGTDNGMFTVPSIRAEMEFLYRISNLHTHVSPEEILKTSTVNAFKILHHTPLKIGERIKGLVFKDSIYKIVTAPTLAPFLIF